MKFINSIFFILLVSSVNGQSKFVGRYKDSFAHTLDIYDDSTFGYSSRLSGAVSCKIGTWSISKNTISLRVDRDCDTSKYGNVTIPVKFSYIDGKLYETRNGKLIKKRSISIPSGKEIDAGYNKQ